MKKYYFSVHPGIAAGVVGVGVLTVFSLLEFVTGVPFLREHMILIGMFCAFISILVHSLMWKVYDKKNNKNTLFRIVFLIEVGIFAVLFSLNSMYK